jgi:hypothetical protein
MSSRRDKKNEFKWLIYSILGIIIGYIFLEYISLKNYPPGENFYVIMGCLAICFGIIKIYLIIRDKFFPKKKKKTKMVFMNEEQKKRKIEV